MFPSKKLSFPLSLRRIYSFIKSAIKSSKVTLRSSDGENFEVDIAVVADQSLILKKKIEEEEGTVISLPLITAKTLSKVIDYCKRHAATRKDDEDLTEFEAEFINVDKDTLFDLLDAADYLKIRNLKNVATVAFKDMVKWETPETFVRELVERRRRVPHPCDCGSPVLAQRKAAGPGMIWFKFKDSGYEVDDSWILV